jgi:pimeloyl-ACP methyl ester carboxylesterase
MSENNATPSSGTATLVLLHGSWGGAWVWDRVAAIAADAGMAVWTPTLSTYGESDGDAPPAVEIDHETHAAEVLAGIGARGLRDIVLVGHSYGAVVASVVAARAPERLRSLVVLDGFLLKQGCSIFDLYPEVKALIESIRDPARPWLVPAPPAAALGVPDGPEARRHQANARPMPIATHANPVVQDLAPLHALARHYLRCTRFPLFQARLEAARREGWRCAEIDSGHMPMLTAPDELAARLLAIAGRGASL